MSHFQSVKTQIKDLKILERVLRSCVYSGEFRGIRRNATVRGYHGNTVKDKNGVDIIAGLVVTMKNGHDVGFALNDEGYYDLTADFYGVDASIKEYFTCDGFDHHLKYEYPLAFIMEKTKSLKSKRPATIVKNEDVVQITITID